MPKTPPDYWFPAKSRGLGWGLPSRWQGWAAVVVFFALTTLGFFAGVVAEGILVVVGLIVLLGAAYLRGDPAGRHWR